MKRIKFTKAQMNRFVGPKKHTQLELAIASAITEQQRWLNEEMKRISPPDIYNSAMSDDPKERQRAADYYRKHSIHIVETDKGMSKAIYQADAKIAEFKYGGIADPKHPTSSPKPKKILMPDDIKPKDNPPQS